jgi:hypothetical protein
MVVGEGEDALDEAVAYLQRIGPAARAMAELPEGERVLSVERLLAMLARHQKNGVVGLPAAAWIVTARAPRL